MSGPFDAGPFGGNPFLDQNSDSAAKPHCPACKKDNFHAYTTQWGLMRRCLECKNEWSGGTVVPPEIGRMDMRGMVPPPGTPAPDDFISEAQYMGASFRDPDKNFDGDE